jgi:hypothetical protein
MAASSQLPATVIAAAFTKVYGRVLDDRTIAVITDPSSSAQEDADQRCQLRKKTLVPYKGRRLICVLISLPGVIYTVEIDPFLHRVIHWEFQAQ